MLAPGVCRHLPGGAVARSQMGHRRPETGCRPQVRAPCHDGGASLVHATETFKQVVFIKGIRARGRRT